MNTRTRLVLMLTMALAVAPLAACGSSTSESNDQSQQQPVEEKAPEAEEASAEAEGQTGMANPFVDCSSASEAAQIAGFGVTFPEAVPGYSERVYQAVEGEMIQCFYRQGDVSVLIRKAKGSDDVSGDYNEYPQVKTTTVRDAEVTEKGKDDLVYVATWTRDGFSYAIDADEGLSAEVIEGLAGSTV
ncbi:MAG: hypothetical protein J6D34_01880 [Atopobiaceae bacterium]|nr:hypothetical protein [Atopobiaceae bacterium]